MPTYIKGEPVANATLYELYKKSSGNYDKLAENTEINFEVSALGLAGGNHTLVVKAKASGYEDSDYSNEVVYSVPVPYTIADFMAANGSETGTYSWDGSSLTLSSSAAYTRVIVPISEIQHLTCLTGSAANKAAPVLFLSSNVLDTSNVVSAVFGEEKPAILDGEAAKSFYVYDADIVAPEGATHIAFSNYVNYTKLSTTPDALTQLTKVVVK